MDDSELADLSARTFSLSDTRRQFLGAAGRITAVGAVGAVAACGGSDESPLVNYPAPTPSGSASASASPSASPTITAITDTDMFVMMLQFHYLQAEFYSRAVFGAPLAAALVTGAGTAGTVTGGRQVTFVDPVLAEMVREIAAEKIDQVVKLRSVLGAATPARPAINIAVDDTGAFTQYGRAAQDIKAPAIYDVYANQEQFLLGAFLLEDPVMVAWRSVLTLMVNAANIDIGAGLLGTSAHHVGTIRTQLYIRGGVSRSTLRLSASRLSGQRRAYSETGAPDDKAVSTSTGNDTATAVATADINPADGDGEIYGRLPNLAINGFYMTKDAVTSGGFFPSGLNGVINTSTDIPG